MVVTTPSIGNDNHNSPTEASWRGILLCHYRQDLHHRTQEPALLCPDHFFKFIFLCQMLCVLIMMTMMRIMMIVMMLIMLRITDYDFDANHHCCCEYGRPAVIVNYDLFCPFLPNFAFKSLQALRTFQHLGTVSGKQQTWCVDKHVIIRFKQLVFSVIYPPGRWA